MGFCNTINQKPYPNVLIRKLFIFRLNSFLYFLRMSFFIWYKFLIFVIMKRIILESPYAGNIKKNVQYARECIKHSLLLGESPIASHLLYTQEGILDDSIPEERDLGIHAGLAWKEVADAQVFYIDYGKSQGMLYALEFAKEHNIPFEFRTIYD